jgi:hypothetical protein
VRVGSKFTVSVSVSDSGCQRAKRGAHAVSVCDARPSAAPHSVLSCQSRDNDDDRDNRERGEELGCVPRTDDTRLLLFQTPCLASPCTN